MFCSEVAETFVLLSAILLPIKSLVAPAVFSIIKWILILSSASSGLELWSVNHTSKYKDSELKAF